MGQLWKCLVILIMCFWSADCRLTTAVRPSSYRLSLDMTTGLDNAAGTYRGSVEILLNVSSSLQSRNFSLHAAGLSVRNSTFTFHTNFGNLLVGHTALPNATADTLAILADNEIQMGTYTLTIEFEAKFQLDLSGFYRNSYQENGSTRWVASTQFESSSARKAFPCFDDPRFRANLTLDITLPMSLHAVTNVPVLNTTDYPNGMKRIQFATSPDMPTYLFAWYVGDSSFGELTNATVNGIRYGIHGRMSLQQEASYALEVAPKVIEQLASFTGVPYGNAGLTKMDQMAVPDFNAGAMENWGLVTYRESYLLYNDAASTAGDKQRSLLVIAHEFAHQWFGDSVTLEWWSYTWLNEAFARYFQYVVSMQMEPSWMLENQFLTDVVQLSMASDYDSHPLTNPDVTTVPEIEDMFDVITYSKGASILRMFSTIIGEANFKVWLNKYLTTVVSKGRVATPDDLWAAMPNPNLTAQFKMWTEVGDHPVVNVSKAVTPEATSLRLSQVKEAMNGSHLATHLEVPIKVHGGVESPLTFVPLGNETSPNPEYSILPLNATPGAAGYLWLKSNETVHLKLNVVWPEWYLINADTAGYYRVMYDEQNWRALRTAISRGEIPPAIRVQLVSDALNLMASGYFSAPQTALEFIGFLGNETDLLVWKSALMAFSRIRDLVLGWKDATSELENHVRTLMDQAFVMKFIEPPNNHTHYEKMLRSYVATQICIYRTKSCDALKGLPTSHMPFVESQDRELDGAFLCEVVKSEPWMWRTLMSMYRNASSPTVKRRYLASLTCTTSTTFQLELLNYVVDPSVIGRQDYAVVSSIAGAENGSQSVLDFIKTNGTKLADYLSNKEHLKNVLSALAQKLYTPKMLDDLDQILQKTNLGLGKEETSALISKARAKNELRAVVAARICRGLGVVCTPPDMSDPNSADTLVISPVALLSTLAVAYWILWQ